MAAAVFAYLERGGGGIDEVLCLLLHPLLVVKLDVLLVLPAPAVRLSDRRRVVRQVGIAVIAKVFRHLDCSTCLKIFAQKSNVFLDFGLLKLLFMALFGVIFVMKEKNFSFQIRDNLFQYGYLRFNYISIIVIKSSAYKIILILILL